MTVYSFQLFSLHIVCCKYISVSLCFMLSGVTDLNFPAAPVNLTAFTYYTPYYRYESGCKYSALNISWEIRFDGKSLFMASTA